jgi:hypothetical protein
LERLRGEGRARLIGVSNYGVEELEEMKGYAKAWPPSVLQIEVSLSLWIVGWDAGDGRWRVMLTYWDSCIRGASRESW